MEQHFEKEESVKNQLLQAFDFGVSPNPSPRDLLSTSPVPARFASSPDAMHAQTPDEESKVPFEDAAICINMLESTGPQEKLRCASLCCV